LNTICSAIYRPLRSIALAALWLLPPAAAATEPLSLVTGNAAPFTTERRDGFFDLIATEMFGRIGVKAEVRRHESSARALVNADRGDDDGLMARIRGLDKQYPNLVIVPEKLFDNDFVACTLGERLAGQGWAGLDGRQVAFIRGWKIFESRLDGKPGITLAHDARQLFELLQRERTEVALYERWQALWYARELALPIRIMEPPLAREEMFIYLNSKHVALASPAAKALADMKRDGSYRRIFEATLGALQPLRSAR
jgi:polar amino acid transport system substrate-binding protein